ncbi:hypothetical protein QTP88_022794 [Uroleucon formosanum]
MIFWQKARIPTRTEQKCVKKLEDLYQEWRNLQKLEHRKNEIQMHKNAQFISKLDDLFDIAHADALNLISIEEDRAFLVAQRQKGRLGSLLGIDKNKCMKEKNSEERMQAENKRNYRAHQELVTLSETVQLQSSSSTDEYDDTDSEAIIVLDKCKISDRNAVHLLIATAEALGNNVNKLIINRSSIRSARIEFCKERAKKIRQDYNLANEETVVVHWDKKLLPALTGKGLVDRLPIVASFNGHEQLLAFCSDTTASNTGRLNGACVLLEQLLEREIVYLPCRHHIYEIVLKSVFDLKLSGTSGPDVAIFKRFQLAWVTMDTKMFNSGIENCIVMGSVNDVCDDIIKFSIDRLEENHPRDDYRELLELTVIFLGGILPNGIHFKKPGAIHHARWMAKAIYSLKIYLFREQFRLTVKEETALRNICIFIIRLYIKSWFDAPSAIKAPFQDLTFIKNLLNYIAIDKDTSQIAIKKFCGHLWYLSAELCGFAFFDEAVSIDTKRKMVKALNNEKSTSEMLSTTQRIIISPKNANELLEKEIEDFVCVKTNNLFKRFAINTDFLKLDPSTWRSNEDFQKSIVLLKKIPVINDVAERGVKLIEEYNDKITKDESQKQYLLQVVSDYRKKFPDHKKETLITSL